MKKLLFTCLLLGGLLPPLQSAPAIDKAHDADVAFFASKKAMLTATWNQPFDYQSIESRHAPLGPFLGNGDVGVVAHTSETAQTLLISKVDFITDGWVDWTGKGPAALPVGGVRIAIDAQPAQGFIYQMDQLNAELRMTTATDKVVEMKTWLGANKNYIVTELSTRSKQPVSISVSTYAGGTSSIYETTAAHRDGIAQVTRRTLTDESVRWISRAGLSTRIVGAAVSAVEKASDAEVNTSFSLTHRRPVYVVTYVSGGGKTDNARLDEAAEKLKALNSRAVARLKKEKEAWWNEMWTRSYVETNDSLLNRHYLSSIYLLASANNTHSPVCGGMYGVWNMNDTMNYHGDIHLNYNSQAGFYSTFSANRPELSLPYFDFIERIMPEGRQRAKTELELVHPSLKGKVCRGPLFSVSALGIGYLYGEYWKQTINAPYNVPLFSWYYEYTGDMEFLRHRAYPFIRECGDFYEDYMQKETYGDSYRYTITTGGHENSWDLNPPSDLGFIEEIFGLLLRYSKLLGVDAERRALWEDILTHLPQYKVIMPTKQPNQGLPVYAKNEAGWDMPAHVIQLHPVYPCEVLNLHSDSTALQLARNTLYYYGVSQRGFTETMNELGLSAFVMGARIGFSPEILLDKMKVLIKRAGTNFLITDGHHCLEKTAAVETINSMMLQSVDNVLYLFPCWTASPASFTRLRTKGAFVVSADYDGRQVNSLKITSEKGNRCQLKNVWKGKDVQVRCNGKAIEFEEHDGVYAFETEAGKTYELRIVGR